MISHCKKKEKIGIIASHDTTTLLPLVDYGLILRRGEMIMQGTSEKILNKPDCLASADLSLPPLTDLSIKLRQMGLPINQIWRNLDDATHDIIELTHPNKSSD